MMNSWMKPYTHCSYSKEQLADRFLVPFYKKKQSTFTGNYMWRMQMVKRSKFQQDGLRNLRTATALAGLEISFFRQAPTGNWPFFFSRQIGKCGRQIVSIKVFLCSKTQTKNFGHNFSFKNQNEGNAFGAAMAIFLPKNKIKYKHADYLFQSPRLRNRMPTIMIYTVLCECQVF